jgi:hypothetical protein
VCCVVGVFTICRQKIAGTGSSRVERIQRHFRIPHVSDWYCFDPLNRCRAIVGRCRSCFPQTVCPPVQVRCSSWCLSHSWNRLQHPPWSSGSMAASSCCYGLLHAWEQALLRLGRCRPLVLGARVCLVTSGLALQSPPHAGWYWCLFASLEQAWYDCYCVSDACRPCCVSDAVVVSAFRPRGERDVLCCSNHCSSRLLPLKRWPSLVDEQEIELLVLVWVVIQSPHFVSLVGSIGVVR